MNGTELCCKFSNITNRLNYCGPADAHQVFDGFVKTGKGEKEVHELLSRFESVFPYLEFIAKKHNLLPFDEKVVEAYWLGNELLDSFTAEDFKLFLPELGKRGLPAKIVEQLQGKVPAGAVPCHVFHVLFVGVGQVSGKVPTTLTNMQNCMASWGEVISPSRIKGPVLRFVDGKYLLSEEERAVKCSAQVGDFVAMHWGECVHILNQCQYDNLQKYTGKVIKAVNSISL